MKKNLVLICVLIMASLSCVGTITAVPTPVPTPSQAECDLVELRMLETIEIAHKTQDAYEKQIDRRIFLLVVIGTYFDFTSEELMEPMPEYVKMEIPIAMPHLSCSRSTHDTYGLIKMQALAIGITYYKAETNELYINKALEYMAYEAPQLSLAEYQNMVILALEEAAKENQRLDEKLWGQTELME